VTTRYGWYLGMLIVLLVVGWRAPGLSHKLGDKAEEGERLSEMGSAPAFALTAQDGRRLSLSELRGKVVVVTFIYTSCADACPLLTAKMAGLQDNLGAVFASRVFSSPSPSTPSVTRQRSSHTMPRLTGPISSAGLSSPGRRTRSGPSPANTGSTPRSSLSATSITPFSPRSWINTAPCASSTWEPGSTPTSCDTMSNRC